VILSGIGWNGSARKCLKLVVERRVFLFVTDELLAEYETVIPETLAKEVPEVHRVKYSRKTKILSVNRVSC
jgi:predicted nucleic acid-binding protein